MHVAARQKQRVMQGVSQLEKVEGIEVSGSKMMPNKLALSTSARWSQTTSFLSVRQQTVPKKLNQSISKILFCKLISYAATICTEKKSDVVRKAAKKFEGIDILIYIEGIIIISSKTGALLHYNFLFLSLIVMK